MTTRPKKQNKYRTAKMWAGGWSRKCARRINLTKIQTIIHNITLCIIYKQDVRKNAILYGTQNIGYYDSNRKL